MLLRALDRGLVDGPRLFTRLLLDQPPERVLRFLDGRSTRAEELAIMATTPTLRMGVATAGDVVARARRRAAPRSESGSEAGAQSGPAGRSAARGAGPS